MRRSLEQRGQRGFSLFETLIALGVLALALVLGLELLNRLPRYRQGLAAQRETMRALEATAEAVRAGTQPLVTGQVVDPQLTGRAQVAGALAIRLEVEPAALGSLYEVRLVGRYFLLGEAHERELETLVWRP